MQFHWTADQWVYFQQGILYWCFIITTALKFYTIFEDKTTRQTDRKEHGYDMNITI